MPRVQRVQTFLLQVFYDFCLLYTFLPYCWFCKQSVLVSRRRILVLSWAVISRSTNTVRGRDTFPLNMELLNKKKLLTLRQKVALANYIVNSDATCAPTATPLFFSLLCAWWPVKLMHSTQCLCLGCALIQGITAYLLHSATATFAAASHESGLCFYGQIGISYLSPHCIQTIYATRLLDLFDPCRQCLSGFDEILNVEAKLISGHSVSSMHIIMNCSF